MSKLEQQIEQVVDTILADYGQDRDIDRMEYHRQPDKDKLIDIIEKLRRIVFPGYFREKTYRIYNAKHNLSMLIEDVMYNLTEQVTRVLQTEDLTQQQAREKAVRLLARTGVRDAEAVMKKYPHMLSGGMRQRVMIAMALSCEPQILIADEPTTALDVTIQLQIMQLLKGLRDEFGMSILLITHDIGVVAEMADRVVVMYAGQCVEAADTRALLNHPQHPYTQALLSAVPGVKDDKKRRLYSIPGAVPENYPELTGCRFAARCPYAAKCPAQGEWKAAADGRLVRCEMAAAEGRKAYGA